MTPDVELPEAAAGAQAPQWVIAVRSARRAGGTWSVTVAAQYADATVRYYAVPVVAGRTGGSFAVMGAPAVVAARAGAPTSPYRVRVADGELASAVEEFLAAYLTGASEVDRYLAPGTVLPALSPAPCNSSAADFCGSQGLVQNFRGPWPRAATSWVRKVLVRGASGLVRCGQAPAWGW